MKPAVLCLLLLSGCSDPFGVRNYRTYKVTWTCVSLGGCERTEQVVLIDRAEIINDDELVTFLSTRDDTFEDSGQMMPSDELPANCFWLHDLAFFVLELEPFKFCRTKGEFDLEISIPDPDAETHSEWLVNGREIDP